MVRSRAHSLEARAAATVVVARAAAPEAATAVAARVVVRVAVRAAEATVVVRAVERAAVERVAVTAAVTVAVARGEAKVVVTAEARVAAGRAAERAVVARAAATEAATVVEKAAAASVAATAVAKAAEEQAAGTAVAMVVEPRVAGRAVDAALDPVGTKEGAADPEAEAEMEAARAQVVESECMQTPPWAARRGARAPSASKPVPLWSGLQDCAKSAVSHTFVQPSGDPRGPLIHEWQLQKHSTIVYGMCFSNDRVTPIPKLF